MYSLRLDLIDYSMERLDTNLTEVLSMENVFPL